VGENNGVATTVEEVVLEEGWVKKPKGVRGWIDPDRPPIEYNMEGKMTNQDCGQCLANNQTNLARWSLDRYGKSG